MKTKTSRPWNPASIPTFWINHASRLLMGQFEQHLRPLGFGMAYLPTLMALKENGALLQKHLAKRARVEQPTMAALLARMERDGMIVREPHPDDKRSSRISLSAKAQESLPIALEQLTEIANQATAGFSEIERDTLIALLRRVVTNIDPELTIEEIS